jgi:hypothetical protein
MNIVTTPPDAPFCRASLHPMDCIITKLGNSSLQEIKQFFKSPDNEELFIIGENYACFVPNEGIIRIYRRTPLPVSKSITELANNTPSIPQDQIDCFNNRLPICKACKDFDTETRLCKHLGIRTTYHLYNSFNPCPLKKWETS